MYLITKEIKNKISFPLPFQFQLVLKNYTNNIGSNAPSKRDMFAWFYLDLKINKKTYNDNNFINILTKNTDSNSPYQDTFLINHNTEKTIFIIDIN